MRQGNFERQIIRFKAFTPGSTAPPLELEVPRGANGSFPSVNELLADLRAELETDRAGGGKDSWELFNHSSEAEVGDVAEIEDGDVIEVARRGRAGREGA